MKHFVRPLVLFAIIVGSPFGVNAQTTSICGDTTGDGVVSSADIFALINRLFADPNAPLATMTIAPPARTGQTLCYDAAGAVIDCGSTGQDGATLRGVVWPQPRFIDDGDGTIRDTLTGLVWLKNAKCWGNISWNSAVGTAAALASGACGLTDGSVAGDWHVPNIVELQTLVDYRRVQPALPIEAMPATFCATCTYWSSTGWAGGYVLNTSLVVEWGTPIPIPNGLGSWSQSASLWPVRRRAGEQAPESSDVNGDGISSVADVFYLAQFLFGVGPAPRSWPARPPRSGQSLCFNGFAPTVCGPATPGQDGVTQRGVLWPSPRFVELGDGTVTDELTGLVWLRDVDCFAAGTWSAALSTANTLAAPACGLSDNSASGDWRLPNINELRSLIDFSRAAPALPFDAVTHFKGIHANDSYWSSTTYANITFEAWAVMSQYTSLGPFEKSNPTLRVWPVRDRK